MSAKQLLILVCVALSAACAKQKSFDERYSDSANEIGARAANIDAELKSGESQENGATESQSSR